MQADIIGTMQPIVRASVAESVYQALRNQLMHGEFQPGQVLGIKALADALGTSTMPVREAFARLVMQQGLQPMRNGSTRVPLISADNLDDIRRARMLIEGTVTEWGAARLSKGQIDVLAKLADEITAARRSREEVQVSVEKNRIFHFTIYQAADSPVMLAMIESLWLQSGPYLRTTREFLHSDKLQPDCLHESAVDAIRAGDFLQARKFIETDVSWVFDHLDKISTPDVTHEPRDTPGHDA